MRAMINNKQLGVIMRLSEKPFL